MAPTPTADPAKDVEAITALEHQLGATTTAAAAMPFFAPGSLPVSYDVVPGVLRGAEAIEANFAALYGGGAHARHEFTELTVAVEGSLGYAFSLQRYTGVLKDGRPLDVTTRQTDIWRKIDGRWLIVHQHVSYPMDKKTGLAVTETAR